MVDGEGSSWHASRRPETRWEVGVAKGRDVP